jgi:hypothetical protein
MGNYSKKQEEKNEGKEKDKVRREKLAGYFFNLSQLSFVTLVIGLMVTLTKESLYSNYILGFLVVVGIIITIIFARIGNNLLK